jgi:hypothetical protein
MAEQQAMQATSELDQWSSTWGMRIHLVGYVNLVGDYHLIHYFG